MRNLPKFLFAFFLLSSLITSAQVEWSTGPHFLVDDLDYCAHLGEGEEMFLEKPSCSLGPKKEYILDVSCENEIVKHMFEIILESMMDDMSKEQQFVIIDTEWIISLTRNATFAKVNGGQEIPESYFQEMQRQMFALGIALIKPVDLKVRINNRI